MVYVYVRDHGPPHVHAVYGGDRGAIDIVTGRVIAGRLGRRQAGMMGERVGLHREELAAAWAAASAGEPPGSIEGLP